MASNEELAEFKRANDLREREVRALELLAIRPAPKNCLQTISEWWQDERQRSMRMNY